MKNFSPTKVIVVINAVIFIGLPSILGDEKYQELLYKLFFYSEVEGEPWRWFTHMFLHKNMNHLLFNSIALWGFGLGLEQYVSKKKYLFLYLLSGLTGLALQYSFRSDPFGALGASGCISGVIGAICYLQPNQKLLLFFVIPLKMKWAFPLIIVISLAMKFTDTLSGVGHLAHVGGLICGYLLAKFIIQKPQQIFFSEEDIQEIRSNHEQP